MTQYMQEAGAMKQATIADAPAVLNTNDKAMWVLGFNAALTAQAWQPIETAPKDGSLLLLSTAKGVVVIGKRNKHLHIWVEVDGRETPRQITYWMPLPAPPLAANEGTLTAGKQGGDGVATVAPDHIGDATKMVSDGAKGGGDAQA